MTSDGRDVRDVAAVDGRRVNRGRIADATEVKDVLLVALEEDAGTAAKRSLAISKHIVGKAEARTEVIPAVVLPTLWQSGRALLDHAVVRVSGTGDDGALRRRLAGNIRRDIDLHRVCGVVGVGDKVILRDIGQPCKSGR